MFRTALPVTAATLALGTAAYFAVSGVDFDTPLIVRVISQQILIQSTKFPNSYFRPRLPESLRKLSDRSEPVPGLSTKYPGQRRD